VQANVSKHDPVQLVSIQAVHHRLFQVQPSFAFPIPIKLLAYPPRKLCSALGLRHQYLKSYHCFNFKRKIFCILWRPLFVDTVDTNDSSSSSSRHPDSIEETPATEAKQQFQGALSPYKIRETDAMPSEDSSHEEQ
jgi:hypothetical protein